MNARPAPHERKRADSHELVDRHEPGDDGAVLDGHVAGHLDRVGDNHIVAHMAVVREVHVGHEEAAPPNRRLAGRLRPAVDRAVLPNHRRVAHLDPGVFSLVLQVLRVVAEHAAVADLHPVAELDVALEDRVRGDVTALAHGNVRPDDGVGTDRDIAIDVGGRIDERGPVDHRSTTDAIMSASATIWPSTYPTPFILHVLPRNWTISSSKRI